MGSANTDLQAQMRKAETKDITENDALTQRHKILMWKPCSRKKPREPTNSETISL